MDDSIIRYISYGLMGSLLALCIFYIGYLLVRLRGGPERSTVWVEALRKRREFRNSFPGVGLGVLGDYLETYVYQLVGESGELVATSAYWDMLLASARNCSAFIEWTRTSAHSFMRGAVPEPKLDDEHGYDRFME